VWEIEVTLRPMTWKAPKAVSLKWKTRKALIVTLLKLKIRVLRKRAVTGGIINELVEETALVPERPVKKT